MDKDQKHIPFAVIVAATNGDETAIQEILDFYDGYISKLSLRKLYDEYGQTGGAFSPFLCSACQSMKVHYLGSGFS